MAAFRLAKNEAHSDMFKIYDGSKTRRHVARSYARARDREYHACMIGWSLDQRTQHAGDSHADKSLIQPTRIGSA